MKTKSFFRLILITITLIILQPQSALFAQQSLEHKIDSLLEAKYEPNVPGGVFLVAKNGNVLYKKAFGMANLELNVPMKHDYVFEIGSMTKQFTAISVLMLVEKGMLNLSDEITKFIPEYPTQGNSITIHHLLTHTSGIKNYTKMKALREISSKDMTPIELIDFFKNESMDFVPGEQFKYNNSGYVILGHIIESLTGKSYASFVEENIFKKIGMKNSFYASHRKIFKNKVSGYHGRKGYTNAMHISYTLPYSAGSLMSNADDMLTWQEALNRNELVSKNTVDKAFTNYTLNNGDFIDYGYGWHIKEMKGTTSREHGGSIFGFKSMGVYLPSEDLYVIGLNNCDCNSPTEVTREIAGLTFEEIAEVGKNKN